MNYKPLPTSVPSIIAEGPHNISAFPYSERHLQCVWVNSALRPDKLLTTDKRTVTVLNPGRWNLEAGPDFLGAALLVDNAPLNGDVEIHVAPDAWTGHGHDTDPRYSNVVAHVCYFPGNTPRTLPPAAIQIPVRDQLDANPFFSFESIDVTAYPFSERRPPAPCAAAMTRLGPDRHAAIFETAGERRILNRAKRIQAAIRRRGHDQAFYEELLAALGYGKNSAPLRQLALRLPLNALRTESGDNPNNAYALLIGVAGLIPSQIHPAWDTETRDFVRSLWDFWWKLRARLEPTALDRKAWTLTGLRPQNHPARRLAAAATIFTQQTKTNPRELLCSVPIRDPKLWINRVSALLAQTAHNPYWQRRLSFRGKQAPSQIALLGPERIAAILCNVMIPFLIAEGTITTPPIELLRLLPREHHNAVAKRTAFTILGPDHNPAACRSALRQQGLLQIFADFCLNDRSDCARCPFTAAVKNWKP